MLLKFCRRTCQTASSTLHSASQTRIVPPAEPLAIRCPSGLHATLLTLSPSPRKTASSAPLSASQTRIVWSAEPLTMRRPSAVYATLLTGPSCPRKTPKSVWLTASQTRTVLSADRSRYVAHPDWTPRCRHPLHVRATRPARRHFQSPSTEIVPSLNPPIIRRQSAPNATLVIAPRCPGKTACWPERSRSGGGRRSRIQGSPGDVFNK